MEDINIYEAASCNNIKFVREALDGKHGKVLPEDLELALLRAAANGHVDCVTLLLESKVNVHARNGNEDTSLMLAAHNGHIEVVRKLLEWGANIHDQNCMGYTALMKACEQSVPNQVEVVETLLDHGANLSVMEQEAVNHGIPNGLPNGLPNGSAKNIPSSMPPRYMPHGYNALMVLVLKQPDNYKKLLRLLLEAGMPVNEKDLEDTTVLQHAANKCTGDVIEMLLQAGAEVNGKDVWGMTPLIVAAGYNKVDNVKALLKYGADVSVSCKAKRTALTVAARAGGEEMISTLLEAGADPECRDAHGRVPLFIAITHYNYAAVKCLITFGCDLGITCRDVSTFQMMNCFECALSRKNAHMVEMLYLAGGCSNKDIISAIHSDQLKEQMKETPEVLVLLNKMATAPRCLRNLCRKVVRDFIRKPLPRSVSELSLPASLKEYLVYSDIMLPRDED